MHVKRNCLNALSLQYHSQDHQHQELFTDIKIKAIITDITIMPDYHHRHDEMFAFGSRKQPNVNLKSLRPIDV